MDRSHASVKNVHVGAYEYRGAAVRGTSTITSEERESGGGQSFDDEGAVIRLSMPLGECESMGSCSPLHLQHRPRVVV